MRPLCVIKSHSKGLTLVLDESCDFESLIREICGLFAKSRDFFKKSEMILSIEGRVLKPQELIYVIEAIELNCDIKVSMILDEGEMRDVHTIGKLDRFYFDNIYSNCKVIKGNVPSGHVVGSDTGLVIIGDLKKGAKAVACGNIICMGTLAGEARAGFGSDESTAFIVAGKLAAKTVFIGERSGNVAVKYRTFSGKVKKNEPIVIRCIQGIFHAEPLSDGLIGHDDV